jgi:hypothetical protein
MADGSICCGEDGSEVPISYVGFQQEVTGVRGVGIA